MIHLITVPETDSTNRLGREMAAHGESVPFAVMASVQTAGRGQRGNTWEAEPGKNITMSVIFRPSSIAPRSQFVLSQAIAVAIVRVLRRNMPSLAGDISVKWPNDIYVRDLKICGILIECSLGSSAIELCVAGIGLNVNQTEFLSPAPNPVSMAMLTSSTYSTGEIAREICGEIAEILDTLPALATDIHAEYMSMLWRRAGFHPYTEPTGPEFLARIHSIAPTGHLTLQLQDHTLRTYAFKEVTPVINC